MAKQASWPINRDLRQNPALPCQRFPGMVIRSHETLCDGANVQGYYDGSGDSLTRRYCTAALREVGRRHPPPRLGEHCPRMLPGAHSWRVPAPEVIRVGDALRGPRVPEGTRGALLYAG